MLQPIVRTNIRMTNAHTSDGRLKGVDGSWKLQRCQRSPFFAHRSTGIYLKILFHKSTSTSDMQEWSGDKFEKSTTMTTAGAARPRSHQETVTPVDEEENGSAYFQVDSEDIDIGMSSSGQPFTLAGLLQNMSPAKCLQPATDMVTVCTSTAYKSCTGSERDELEHQILGILKEVRGGNIKARTIALQKLYRLTDREHRQNR